MKILSTTLDFKKTKIKTLILGLSITCVFSILSLSSCSIDATSSVVSLTTDETSSIDDSSTSEEIVERDYLPTVTFSFSRYVTPPEDNSYSLKVSVFDSGEEMIDYFSAYPYVPLDDLSTDVDNFEEEYGFEDYLLIYFEEWVLIGYEVGTYIDEADNGNIVVAIDYIDLNPNSDVYLPAEDYRTLFFLLDKNSFEDQISSIMLKLDEEILYSEEF